MGVAGLWEVLRPAGQVRSLTELAVEDGFNANRSHRGFRIGIDASIWFFHAAYGREGENPELRTLFFRCCRLLQSPLLPLFVFDGPNRPAVKRGKRVGGNIHWLTQGMKNIIDAFGFEWRVAPGEAEADLAYLNRVGIIDAVLSDDVDNFLFGATMVIRNPSNTLSGNRAHPVKNAQGKDDGNHVITYTADAILSNHSVALSREGTILIGLLSGGDYIPAGLPGCGQKFATGLARAGFGDSLVKAVKELKGARLDAFLDEWRQDIRHELRTNSRGLLPSKKPSLAASLSDDFPSLPVLMSYADPITSENTSQSGKRKTPSPVWRNDPDPMIIASLCELYFEWGVKDVIVHRFRTVLWPGIVCRAVRRAVIDQDKARRPKASNEHYHGSEEGDNIAGPSSPTRGISTALSALALSSPSEKPTPTSTSDPPESFRLLSLVPLTSPASPSSPSASALLLEVVSQRTHISTDSTLEYRILVNPTAFVERAESGVKGLRPPLVGGLFGIDSEDEDSATHDQDANESGSNDGIERLETAACAAAKSGTKKRKSRRKVPTTPLRLWVPACMIRAAAPALAEAYEEKVRVCEEKKAKRGTGSRRGRAGSGVSRRIRVKDLAEDEEDQSVPGPSTSKTAAGLKPKAKTVRTGGGRRKAKHASEAQDDAYEFIDLSAGESPCSSDGENVDDNAKGKGKAKAKTRRKEIAKPMTNASSKTNVTNMTADTMEFFDPTRFSTFRATKSKPSAAASKRIGEEEEKGCGNADFPPPLPKSSRPLDLIRAKSRLNSAPLNPTSSSISKSKPTAVPRCEEESSSSSLPSRSSGVKHNASNIPSRTAQPVLQARKKPLFVDVSDTDSEIEVSDIRGMSPRKTAAANSGMGDMNVGIGVGKTLSTAKERVASGSTSRSKSTSISTDSIPHGRVPSTSLDTNTSIKLIPGVNTGKIDIARNALTPLKPARILLPPSALESEEEEESEEDELPMFHRGSVKARAKKPGAPIARPAPRPFPMQLVSGSPVSPSTLGRGRSRYDDKGDDDDEVEIVDIFTTPRGPSPPRTPTPSPSPLPVCLPGGPATSVQSVHSDRFPASPTKTKCRTDIEPQKWTKENHLRLIGFGYAGV
ncbi:hypothetical protein JVU11DRAFT_8969 [Chiua virens]|nr:hypothetical protein JVU11DRAFT_8969 [Chiua virens]